MEKSPLNYTGGKYKLLPQILPIFPKKINTFVDLFCGGCNVGINVKNANKVILNDNLTYLIDMYTAFKNRDVIAHVENRIEKFNLTLTNTEGYNNLRDEYNSDSSDPLDLFVLIAYSFNHQIRFNNSHKFNTSFGKSRSSFNSRMENNLIKFLDIIKKDDFYFTNIDFNDFDFSMINGEDFVYCDPPYLITTGSYNDGKRGFKGWTELEENQLLYKLDELNRRNIKFALSNVIEHKGKSNNILKNWVENMGYKVHYMDINYANSNYQTSSKGGSVEVLITNY